MRILVLLCIVASNAVAQTAPEPSFSCDASAGCIEEASDSHDLGQGAVIKLPSRWTFYSYPMPRAGQTLLRQVRAFNNGVIIAVTPFPNLDGRTISEEFVRNAVSGSGDQYARASREEVTEYVSISRGEMVGGLAAFTSKTQGTRPFRVLPNRRYASVTTMLISYKLVLFSISVASERTPDDDYRQAVEAFRQIE